MAAPTELSRTVCLIGLRCSGKTTLGRELARAWGCEFVDLDDEVLAAGREAGTFDSVGEVLAVLGLEAFRALESVGLERVLAHPSPRVLATGGGVVEDEANRRRLATVTCVWLRADPEVLRARMRADPALRPSLTGTDPEAELERLQRRREPWYRALASVAVDGDCGPPPVVRVAVEAALREL